MASVPTHTTTIKTVNNRTGVTTSSTTKVSGGSTTVTRTTTIGKPKSVSSAHKTGTTTKAPAKAAGAVLQDTRWITGPNDTGWTMCGPVAVANHLLAVTGVEASNRDIERLYKAAGAIGDSGAPLEFFLAAATSTGLAGCRLAAYTPAGRVTDAGVLLLAVNGVTDLHAAAVTPTGDAVLWGTAVPLAVLDARVEDAWSLTWHGGDAT